VPSPAAFAAGWILGGVLALAGALTFAELAALYPRTGGMYVYIREAFGRAPAFLFGWAELLIIRPASFGAIAITSAEYAWRLVGIDGGTPIGGVPYFSRAQITGALLIALVGVVNYRGVQLGAIVQNISTAVKVAALALIVAVGFALAPATPAAAAPIAPWALSGFGLALVSILWAYDGWADVAFVSGEVRDPQRNLPRALFIGTTMVVVLYLAANLVYAHVIPLAKMPGSPLIAADAAYAVAGSAGVAFVSAAVMISTFGTLNGSMMTGPRVFFAMAEDRLFFQRLAAVHQRFGTPAASITLAALLGIVYVSIRTFGQLADQFIIGIWPFYALAVAAVFVLRRRRPEAERPYRTLGYPAVPALFLLASLYLLGNYMVSEPVVFGIDVLVILAGLPVFFWLERRQRA
jgi:amino acid transporter